MRSVRDAQHHPGGHFLQHAAQGCFVVVIVIVIVVVIVVRSCRCRRAARRKVEWLTDKMRAREFTVSCTHGDIDQKERDVRRAAAAVARRDDV